MSTSQKIVRVRVIGRVQGVGYRAFAQREAEARGVTGWVRNRLNGDVEAVFAGSAEAVTLLCEICRRGPRQARVENIEIFEADLSALAEAAETGRFHQLTTV